MRAAQLCGERTAEARLRNQFAVAFRNLGRLDEATAQVRIVLDLAALKRLGHIYRLKGEFDVALRYFREGLDAETRHERVRGIGLTHRHIGELLIELGRIDEAIAELQESEALLDNVVDKARARMFLSRALLHASQFDEAVHLAR